MKINAAIVGVGASEFGRGLPDSQLGLAAKALKAALEDCGLRREDVDGLSIHLGWPLGLDYDRVADGLGLSVRYVVRPGCTGGSYAARSSTRHSPSRRVSRTSSPA